MPFYGLFIPAKNGGGSTAASCGNFGTSGTSNFNIGGVKTEPLNVFNQKSDALAVLKLHKDARLREFINRDDAIKYALTGYEVIPPTKYPDAKTNLIGLEKAAFRGPTKQELIQFRKLIENNDYQRVKTTIWDNPRYLVSSGDTPTTLKEGYRYNALHICAISKKPRIAELILTTVSDPKFVDLLTGKKNDPKMCKELCANLLDYYLNIPEKGRSETPLHLAVKNGHIEVIEVLISYPECKMTPNSDGALPKDIICSRLSNASPEVSQKIKTMLEARFYVPVLRSADKAIPPTIGQPFEANNPPVLNSNPLSPEVKIQALAGPMKEDEAKQFCRRWKTPPRLGSNTISPVMKSLFISPIKSRPNSSTPLKTPNALSKSYDTGIRNFQRRSLFINSPEQNAQLPDEFATPVKNIDKQNGNHKNENDIDYLLNASNENYKHETSGDTSKNINNNVENKTVNNDVQPITSSPVTTKFAISGALGLKTPSMLKRKKDAFMHYRTQSQDSPIVFDSPYSDKCDKTLSSSSANIYERDLFDSPGQKERHIKISDPEKGLEMIGRELAKSQKVEWREYWDFLDAFIDITSNEGLSKFENYLTQLIKDDETAKDKTHEILDDVCNALESISLLKDARFENRDIFSSRGRNYFNDDRQLRNNGNLTAQTEAISNVTQPTNPYTCVEKSLQVFAKRMTKTIIHNIENIASINDTLLSELKRLKSLICSFKEDIRFLNVDFSKVHSRIGNLISIYIESSQEVDEQSSLKIQLIIDNMLQLPGNRRGHIECVCKRIYSLLHEHTPHVLPENLKTEEMCAKMWLKENTCDCQWDPNMSRKTSRRIRLETRYKNFHQAKSQKKEDTSENTTEQCVSNALFNDDLDDEEDVFWSDFDSLSSDEDEDIYYTPPEVLSPISGGSDDGPITHYIFGREPTKRDLDVLNAIFHLDIDKEKYPNIHNWKNSVLRFSTNEMEFFPMPTIINKSHSLSNISTISNNSNVKTQTPINTTHNDISLPVLKPRNLVTDTPEKSSINTKSLTSLQYVDTPTGIVQQRVFITPINKMKGLFSNYREKIDGTPMESVSVRTPDGTSSDFSLFNVSTDDLI